MLRLEVDSEAKSISVEVQLRGQPAPLRVKGNGYQISSEAGEERLRFESVEASEEWLSVVLRFAGVAEKGAPLPEKYAELIRLAL